MKKLLLLVLTFALLLSFASFSVFADEESVEESAEISETVSDEASEESEDEPVGFMGNIKYMGLGMVGIFLVIGVVILITVVLNAVTSKKKA
jgi:hypothetical protein